MTLQSNTITYGTPQFGLLSRDQLDRLHHASLEILDRTGVLLYDQAALDLLAQAGVQTVDGNRVRIPPGLVDWALSMAPRRVVLCDRNGGRALPLERQNVFYGPGSDCPYVLDHRTGQRRPGTLRDIREGIRLCDALPNIDFLMSLCVPSDMEDPAVADRYQMHTMLANSTKPIIFVTTEFGGCIDAVRMLEAVAGGEEALRRDPIAACYINVTDPLRHNAEALQKLLYMAGKGLPCTYTPVVLRGLNGPVTPAGALALANAGELVGLTLAQLKREGAPVIHSGGYNDMFDMRTMVALYGDPKGFAGRTQLTHHYGLPSFGLAGATDAKLPDQQAGAEVAFSLMLETFIGANLVHDLGYLESGKCYSFEQLVICDELVNYLKRFMQGLEVTDETLALDLIDEMGPGGDYLGTDQTMERFREDWYPELLDRQDFSGWDSDGGTTLRERARERVEELLASHHPDPLPDDVEHRIRDIVKGAGAGASLP
ncbi:MAG: trimethylamine methyltransferase family protein [Anaerolineae bacterium]